MEGETEFEWEVLVNSDSEAVNSPKSVDDSKGFEEIGADSESVIRLDYFSLENDNMYKKSAVDTSDGSSVESGNPSWIDPGSDYRYQGRNSGELWLDSGSDRSEERKSEEVGAVKELGISDCAKTEVEFEGISEVGAKKGKEEKFEPFDGKFTSMEEKSELDFEDNMKSQVNFEGFDETQRKGMNLAELWSNSDGDAVVSGDAGKKNESSAISDELDGENVSEEGNSSVVAVGENQQQDGNEEKRKVVWWKVPFEVLKFCVFRVSPIWSISMATAVMGLVILGRRLYKMKHKSRTLRLKVAVDDKKVSQVMSRAARLNEAFSVVRRVPIVRPLLPAAGLNPWPVMSLR